MVDRLLPVVLLVTAHHECVQLDRTVEQCVGAGLRAGELDLPQGVIFLLSRSVGVALAAEELHPPSPPSGTVGMVVRTFVATTTGSVRRSVASRARSATPSHRS